MNHSENFINPEFVARWNALKADMRITSDVDDLICDIYSELLVTNEKLNEVADLMYSQSLHEFTEST